MASYSIKKVVATGAVLIFAVFCSTARATDYTALSFGNWNDPAIWDQGGTLPGSADNALIPITNGAGGVTIGSGVDANVNSVQLTIKDGLLTMNGGNLTTAAGLNTNFTGTQVIFSNSSMITGDIGTGGTKKIGHLLINAGVTATVDGDINIQYIRLPGNDPDQTFKLAEGHTLTGNIYVGSSAGTFTGNHGNVEFLGAATVNGYISVVAPGDKPWAGTVRNLILNSGTVNVTGDVRAQNYDLKSSTLAITGNVIQGANGTLSTTMNSATTCGQITSTGTATIPVTATVSVTVNRYVPAGSVLVVVDGTGGVGVDADIPVASSSAVVSFASNSVASEDLTITSSRSNSYNTLATNSNTAAVGSVLEAIGAAGATGDMLTVLNSLDSLTSPAAVEAALQSMIPNIDNGVPQATQAALDQFVRISVSRLDNFQDPSLREPSLGRENHLDDYVPETPEIWTQGFGTYLHQDPRASSNGYDATIWGTALGLDLPVRKPLKIGASGGFAQDHIRTKDSSSRTDVNSYQGALYGTYGWERAFVDLLAAFAYNTYDSTRHVAAGAIDRIASGAYNGQQYTGYIGGGYRLDIKDLAVTPIASFQYTHLRVNSYQETGAGALSLNVGAQDTDVAQTGLGVKFARQFDFKTGSLIPELRVKWLYDWVGDDQQLTSTFTGGGGAFTTNGFTPAQSSYDFGAKLTFITHRNITISANYDFELKEDFYGHYGYAELKYAF